jgi:hypothetical protein
MRPPKPVVAAAAVAVAIAALAGCGSDGPSSPAAPSALVRGPAGYFTAGKLEQRLSNAFRAGLYRLAVMSQPGEGAIDLGQQLPTGKVSAVSCTPAGAAPAGGQDWPWHCDVRWRTVAGTPRLTRYGVQLTAKSCFDAAARPRYDAVLDATTGAPAEHPLNTFGRSLGSC